MSTSVKAQAVELTDAQVDRLLDVRIPGGSSARDWFLPHELPKGIANVRDVVRRMVAALPPPSHAPVAWRQWSSKWHDWEYQVNRGDLRSDEPVEALFLAVPSTETGLAHAYASGRKDEREEWLPVLEALKSCWDLGIDSSLVPLVRAAIASVEGKS